MGEPDSPNHEWYKEFQKANAPAPAADPRGSERRRHPRFEVDEAGASLYREGLLAFIGVGKENVARAALDLSESGVRLLLHHRLAIGSKVKVRIHIEKYNEAIEAPGVVRWCFQSAKKTSDFYAGVEFIGLDASHGRKIALMKDWFTSPQYKAIRETRIRQKKQTDAEFA